jgi:hypothetical protein
MHFKKKATLGTPEAYRRQLKQNVALAEAKTTPKNLIFRAWKIKELSGIVISHGPEESRKLQI